MFKYSVNIPLSRFRREHNTWKRFFDKNPDNTINLTRNNKVITVVITPRSYEELEIALEQK